MMTRGESAREAVHLASDMQFEVHVTWAAQHFAAVAALQPQQEVENASEQHRVAPHLLGFVDKSLASLDVADWYTEVQEHDRVLAVLRNTIKLRRTSAAHGKERDDDTRSSCRFRVVDLTSLPYRCGADVALIATRRTRGRGASVTLKKSSSLLEPSKSRRVIVSQAVIQSAVPIRVVVVYGEIRPVLTKATRAPRTSVGPTSEALWTRSSLLARTPGECPAIWRDDARADRAGSK